jgi:hypothetical protein
MIEIKRHRQLPEQENVFLVVFSLLLFCWTGLLDLLKSGRHRGYDV